MTHDKEHPALLTYALGFFLLLTIIGYLMLINSKTDSPAANSDVTNLKIPSYQNLFSPE